jgi:hypothetical protein
MTDHAASVLPKPQECAYTLRSNRLESVMAANVNTKRKTACKALLKQAEAIIAKEGSGPAALERIMERLVALA